MTSVRRALAISFAERYALIGISLASNILLARLLSPEQIGIYSVSLAVIGIAQVLRDFGVGNFLIQEKNLSDAHIRTAFGMSLVIGAILFAAAFIAAPWAGRFYGEPQMVATLQISALNFLVLPFCSISVALLRRAMQFQRLLVVTLASTMAGFVVTVGLAYAGFGPNSMAIGSLVSNIFTGAGAALARPDRKLLFPAFSEWRVLAKFGVQSSMTSVITTIAMDVNDLAIGRILGFAPVAIISRAQGLTNLFSRDLMTAIRNVAFPAYSKAHRDGESLEARYVASVAAVTALAWPFYGFSALFGLEIMRLLFGPQWDAAARLVPVFSLAGAIFATSSLITTAILAVGRIDLVTKSELVFQPIRAAAIIAAALAYRSLFACAVAYLIAFVFYTPFIYWIKEKCISTDSAALWRNLLKSLKVTVAALVIPFAVALHSGFERSAPLDVSVFLAAAVAALASWIGALMLFGHPVTTDPVFVQIGRRVRSLTGWSR